MVGELVVAAGVVLGCGGTPMEQQLPPIRTSRAYSRQIDTLGVEMTVAAPAAKVWAALPEVYRELGLDINFREPGPSRTGTCYQRVRGRLGKLLLSSLLDCGENVSMPNADRFDVALTVLSTVIPISDQVSRLVTFVLGVGIEGTTGGNRLWCYSTGVLEDRIRQLAEERARA